MSVPAVILAPRVFRIPTFGDYINSYALVDDDGQVTLVDCGLRRAPRRIVEALDVIGSHPSQVTRILLTHAHSDHAGGAAEMVRRTGLPGVDLHEEDAPFVGAGHNAPTDGSTTAGRLLARLPGQRFTSVPVSATLEGGELLDIAGGLRVLHTPGHSPGHVSLLHEPTGVLITGDAIFNMRARLRWPIAAICTSSSQNRESAQVFTEIEYDVAAFTHGPEIRDRPREAIRDFLRRQA